MSERSITTILSTLRSISIGRIGVLLLIASQALFADPAGAADEPATVIVADPYLEMRTGPGVGYPKFHVVDRGEAVAILKRRTDWFLVRSTEGREGWVDRAQLQLTLQPSGEPVEFTAPGLADFTNSRWEAGVLAGDFGGANILSVYGAYSLNPHVGIEVWGSQILGNFSNGWMASLNVIHETWPDWRISPFFTLGTGVIHTEPKSTIVQGEDRTDQVAHVGAGVRMYATQRFLLRAEYKSYVVFTSRDDNEEVEEWKVGFAFFF
ncbi:MAG: SH3 domain-containing protein [Gammaproteobacteria bacterium]|nr:SH3 domain-containing protein [Gammaproteobacteria bacterium]MDH4253211.1 SH3 domain-containing protein [Gammaproteobacteria bacterium]MDH5309010.1 SH3 domain-containing protein [Gammaproteobacteria bacterium]